MYKFDVVVVGGGHAGVEAAHAVYRLGLSCALVTFNKKSIGQMSCNPSNRWVGKITYSQGDWCYGRNNAYSHRQVWNSI
jgi:tRNA U34 5-carboxymethylaminomethyl modifying enzyme MnmG/GidA